MTSKDYLYLRAWDRMMGSTAGWCEMNLERAREENAPPTAVYRRSTGSWAIFEDITSADTKNLVSRLVEQYEGKLR